MTSKELINKALEAMNMSYSPYSEFKVGAALLCDDGAVYTGCNIENSAFSPTCCAERVAIFKAISEGNNKFSAIAVVGGKLGKGKVEGFCSPCGVCRQVMAEFCGKDFTIYMFDGKNEAAYSLEELLPESFLL